jgi:hypothetical protein
MEAPIVDWKRFFEDVKYTYQLEQALFEDIPDPFKAVNHDSSQEVDEGFFAICEDIVAARNSR